MKVKELIALLQDCDQEAIVVMSSDAEGNSYSPFSGLWEGVYVPDTTWSGEVGYGELTPELKEYGFTEEDIKTGGESAVILQPIN